MSQKQAKKLRQTFNRELKQQANELIESQFSKFIKPKPKLVPKFIWKKIQKIVLK